MTQNRAILQHAAMQYGTMMGLFWIIKFTFIPLGIRIPSLHILFFLLTLCVPFIGFIFARRFRIRNCDNTLSYERAFSFLLLMYIYASILVAAAHYVYFQFMDKGALLTFYKDSFLEFKNMADGFLLQSIHQMEEAFDTFGNLSSIEITFSFLSNNIFYCFILTAVTALFVMRKKTNRY